MLFIESGGYKMDYKELEKIIIEKLSQRTMDAIRQQKKRQDPEAAERIEKFQQSKDNDKPKPKGSGDVVILQILRKTRR